nr:hypothetical protein B0A51_17509 [Rachicladosporium sp. CCFEE 5018]
MFSNKKWRKGTDTACIFIHAGAGYHSVANEITHLQACSDAANMGMKVLRGGGSAVEGVELALKCLEDREITNAGYGSNLAMDGVVECDAVIVDHNGRSGGAGAVAQIKNPISLARLLLDFSATQLSLRRVPPNLLVGQGATDFAWEHGMKIMPFESLVSPAAKERWTRWSQDLRAAERKEMEATNAHYGLSPAHSDINAGHCQPALPADRPRRHYTDSLSQALYNDAQPISPPQSDEPPLLDSPPSSGSSRQYAYNGQQHTLPNANEEYTDPDGPPYVPTRPSGHHFANSTQSDAHTYSAELQGVTQPSRVTQPMHSEFDDDSVYEHDHGYVSPAMQRRLWGERSSDSGGARSPDGVPVPPGMVPPSLATNYNLDHSLLAEMSNNQQYPPLAPSLAPSAMEEDLITDTVGAIAIDVYGNIACGASSGGIGMKHRGRIGPAALVGIGAHVIPTAMDEDRTSVATVTSGTGEHMGTTLAASTCSDRVFFSHRATSTGAMEVVNEDEAIKGFIENDFMGHPSVKNSQSAGAIGVLSVKRIEDGAMLFFAHNTDSFALASMSSDDRTPSVVMSRNHGSGSIAQGGKFYKFKRRKS